MKICRDLLIEDRAHSLKREQMFFFPHRVLQEREKSSPPSRSGIIGVYLWETVRRKGRRQNR